jgi:hypothetical protein
MKYINSYKLFESDYIDDLSYCLVDIIDMGFEPEEAGLDLTKEFKRVHHEEDLLLAIKLVKCVNSKKFNGYIEDKFTVNTFNIPNKKKFTNFEKELLDALKDSVNKLTNIYLPNTKHGTYIINQYSVAYGTCVVVILKFYK